jgi:hypothetical protein
MGRINDVNGWTLPILYIRMEWDKHGIFLLDLYGRRGRECRGAV